MMMVPDTTVLRIDGSASAAALPRFADRIGHLQGWRRVGLALLLGLLAAPAMPPFNLAPLLLPSFTGLIWLLDGAASRKRACYDGWLWGMGFFVPNLYWVAAAMFVDLAQFWWMVPICILGLPAVLSLYTGAATGLYRALRLRNLARIGLFAFCWVLAEWLRGHVPLGGFPWVVIGYAWSGDSAVALDLLQSTSLFGVYGLSFFTVLVAALPARLGDPPRPGQSRLRPLWGIGIGAALLFVAIAWGADRLANGITGDVPGVTLRIIQTDLANRDNADDADERLQKVFALAGSRGADSVTAQIWPESSVEFLLNQQPELEAAIGRLASPGGLILTGTALAHREGDTFRDTNSVAAIGGDGQIVGSYAKAHLVPVGEYIPLHDLLSFIPVVADRGGGWSTGPGPTTLHLPNLPPVAPIVCYEAIFPHAVIDEADRPAWLLNDTNDAWFGRSIGPEQHFALARVRTVEEGLPLIRAANGGISGVVDAYGRRVMTLPLGEEIALDVKLPNALPTDTLYGRVGDIPLLLIAFIALLASIASALHRNRGRY
jgi:apolipoprotein N-acyltransferase